MCKVKLSGLNQAGFCGEKECMIYLYFYCYNRELI